MSYRIIGRNSKWVSGATITETIDETSTQCRFVATIRGWQNWRMYEGKRVSQEQLRAIIDTVRTIRDRIDADDEAVFHENHIIREAE